MSERDGVSYQHVIGPDGQDHVTTIVEADTPPGSEPLSDERLARAQAMVRLLTLPGVMAPETAAAIQTVLAEVDRLRAEVERALVGQADARTQVMMAWENEDAAKSARDKAMEVVRAVVATPTYLTEHNLANFMLTFITQARAVLAAVEKGGLS